jgi:DNA-binding transcriptional ArsR family regulator
MYRDEPSGPAVVVRPSIAVELEWVLAAAALPEDRRDNAVLVELYGQRPDLAERVRTFWGPPRPRSGTGCDGHHLELLVLAHHGGLLYSDDADELLRRLEALCTSAPTELPLPSESERDRAETLERLTRLRQSRALRRKYVALVGEVWEAIRGSWHDQAKPAVERAIAARATIAERGSPWQDVAIGAEQFGGALPRLVAALQPEEELAVVPAFFTHRGLLVSLPGVLVLGVRVDPIETGGAADRARTEGLARQLKAIVDPTRLAILAALASRPRTVTELAERFGLAQPTVSNHIKMLDEAGLITKAQNAARRSLEPRADAIGALVHQLEEVLAPADARAITAIGPHDRSAGSTDRASSRPVVS